MREELYSENYKNKKRNTKKNILTILLVLLVIGLTGYIVYDKVISKPKPEKKEPVKTEKVKKEDLDKIAKALVDKLEEYDATFYDDKENVNFSEVSDEDKILGAYLYGNDYKLTKETVDDYYNNLFGIELKEYPSLNCWTGDGIYAKYNEEIDEYEIVGDHAHGGIENHPKADIIKYNNIEKNKNDYIVTVTKVFYPNMEASDGYFYADYNYKTRIKALDQYGNHELSDRETIEVQNYYEQNYDQFKDLKPMYKYTFTKKDNDYYLKSLETIK